MSAGPMSYCPICGAVNPPEAERCVSCRRVLPGKEGRIGQEGQPNPASSPNAASTSTSIPGSSPTPTGGVSWTGQFAGVPDSTGYPEYDYGPYRSPLEGETATDSDPHRTAPYAPAFAPYAASNTYAADDGDRYGYGPGVQGQTQAYDAAPPSGGDTIVSPSQPLPPTARRPGGGRGGCLMGCLAGLIIGLVAVALVAVAIVRPALQEEVGDEIERVVATQIVRQLAPGDGTPELTAGAYTISADEINAELRQNADDYDPLENPQISIDPDGLELSFDAYGAESSYRGGVDVEDGRLILTDVDASGIARQVLPADDVQEIIERELNGYVADAGLIVTDVELTDGAMTLTTAANRGSSATPVAATPAPRAAAPTSPPGAPTPRVIAPPRTVTPAPQATLRATETPDAEPTSPLSARPRPAFPRPSPTPDTDADVLDDGPAGDGTGL